MSQTKTNHLAEIASMMRLYKINLNDIELYEKTHPKPFKKTPKLIFFLSYLGGLLMLGGLGIFLKEHWVNFGSVERITITYGVGVSLYFTAIALYYKKVSTLTLSNLFVIALVFQWGGLGIAIREFFPDGSNVLLFVLSISSLLFLQAGATFIKVRLTAVLFMTLIFLSLTYGAFVSYLFGEGFIPYKILQGSISTKGIYTLEIFAVLGGLMMMAIVQKIQKTQYNAICGVWFFAAMAVFYSQSYIIFNSLRMTEFFGLFVLFGLGLSQVTRSKAMLTLTAIALCGYLANMTTKYFINTPWWPLSLVSMGLLVILIAFAFYKKAQTFK